MSAAARWILVIALAAVAVVVLLFGGELTAGQVLGAGATGTGGSGDAGFGELGGYLTILILVDIGLGTVVAWFLFGNRE